MGVWGGVAAPYPHFRLLFDFRDLLPIRESGVVAKPTSLSQKIILAIEPYSQHRKQPVSINWLGKVIIRSCGDALFQIALHGFGGQRQNRQVLELVLGT